MKIGKFAVGFVEDDGRARNVGKQQYRKIANFLIRTRKIPKSKQLKLETIE
jgi:hypothetical protein